MARIRVFLLTCRRPHLLRRALDSLLRQSLTDWVCEVHNDEPGDEAPGRIISELAPGDPRIDYRPHTRNWGPVAVFNHAYAGGPEPYGSILEDDNWWEPDLLARLLSTLEDFPAAALAWANMRLWQELPDGTWSDTGRTVWRCSPDLPPRCFNRPVTLQAVDALHSNGAMVFRTALSARARVPEGTPLDIIEPVRERLLSGGLVLVPAVLANFAIGRTTARPVGHAAWLESQLWVAESFFQRARLSPETAADLWERRRSLRPRSTDALLVAALCGAAPRSLLRGSRAGDWLHFLPRALRHPRVLWRGLRFRRVHPELWRALRGGNGPLVEAGPPAAKELSNTAA